MSTSDQKAALGKIVVIVLGVVALGVVIWQGANFISPPERRNQMEAMDISAEIDRLAVGAKGDINTLSEADRKKLIELVGDEQRAVEVVQQRGGTLPAPQGQPKSSGP